MTPAVAIVGMACRYPDARSPGELWENVLAQRRAFRRMPSERLRLEDYLSSDHTAPDRTYVGEAALIEGYEFDRARFRVVGSTFRSADMTHWLALDVAAQALADAGFPEGEGLPRETTGVLLGNTLTGEFSRANVLRLRWPYVNRVVDAALNKEGWSPERRQMFLRDLETTYKAPFPPVGEETLAGSLSNTIAGRICNHFDLKGGGYTVDGACASSLLAVSTACAALTTGDLDVALAGGVDLSLDPFELVGFAKTEALAPEEMRIYDVRSAGFWPGEGCGVVVLMRYADAVEQRRRIYASIRGWGVSSDGAGGLTRPEVEGQILALRRAYRRAGIGIETVSLFEGHGTGTEVGDATELRVLSRARREAGSQGRPAAIGSIKANIGHTKAAAGVAGLIKATMALQTHILPPTTGCTNPHPAIADFSSGEPPALRVLREAELWAQDQPLRAAVSAMGFGGINAHLVLEGVHADRRRTHTPQDRVLLSSAQDAELFLMGAQDPDDLGRQVDHLAAFAARLSRAELGDLAAQMERTLGVKRVRAAVVASTPEELADRLEILGTWLKNGVSSKLNGEAGVFLGSGTTVPRIGFLFPGQGSPAHLDGGLFRRRFDDVRDLYVQANLPLGGDGIATEIAQPAIVTSSMAALRVLNRLGITGCLAVGHSLGELTALHWAGAMDEVSLLRIAAARGKAMAQLGSSTGAMAGIGAGHQEVKELLNGGPVVIAGLNSPRQTVISGEAAAVAAIVVRARANGFKAVTLPVSHAFHSALVAGAVPPFAEQLSGETFRPLRGLVLSTVTGSALAPDEDLQRLLFHQITFPVRFTEAVTTAAQQVDLFLEVGPGQVLSGLIGEFVEQPVMALDAGGPSLKGLWRAVGAAYALGAPVRHDALFVGRFTRPFDLNWHPRFFVNPCELAPVSETMTPSGETQLRTGIHSASPVTPVDAPSSSPLDLVRQLVAARVELPPSAIKDDIRLLKDLHLNSIAVGQVVAEAARRLGLSPPVSPTDYAEASVAHIASALEDLIRLGAANAEPGVRVPSPDAPPPGVDSWVRPFTVELVERPLAGSKDRADRHATLDGKGTWHVLAPLDHPFKDSLQEALARFTAGSGVVVCVPPEPDERHVGLLLEGAHLVFAQEGATHFVLVQQGGGAASFARTLHLERPHITTCVVDIPAGHAKAVEWVLAEIAAAVTYAEAQYDASGRRRVPVLRLLPVVDHGGARPTIPLPLSSADVLLVTGGGKGIAAECAFALAKETGVRLALLGRAQPAEDAELAANLARFTAGGITFRYIPTDVIDAQAVQAAVRAVESSVGPVTAVLHGAGANVPQLLASLDEAAFLRTLAPKVQGARNVLAAVDPKRLRLFVAFGSIIARAGFRGEADYAVANEWLTRLVERFQQDYPSCRCLSVEWSVWSGVGMGERLGRMDALVAQGIAPISLDQGLRMLQSLLAKPLPAVAVVVTGRFGDPPTLVRETPDLPFLRFLERPRVWYPGVELVVEADLSTDTDPYVGDHVFGGERLLPAVMGLEAMSQAAVVLTGSNAPLLFEDVHFSRPVVIPKTGSMTIRVAALLRESGQVDVVLRSSETGFHVDHFRATCRVNESPTFLAEDKRKKERLSLSQRPLIPLVPERDLYGHILFHQGRFRRVRGYRLLRATECLAEIAVSDASQWFGRYLPQSFLLGDPGARDAVIHAIQACIPHGTLLPIGVDRLTLGADRARGSQLVHARERSQEGNLFVYDVDVTGPDGVLHERWEGLRLRKVTDKAPDGPWSIPLLGPYAERRVKELIPGTAVTVVVEQGEGERQARSDHAMTQALGRTLPICRRPDGKPEIVGDDKLAASASHVGELTLAVAGPSPLACDMEPVTPRAASVWQDLLGSERTALADLIAGESGEDQHTAFTRVWCASECLKKIGAMVNAPLVLASIAKDGWVALESGPVKIATCVVSIHGLEDKLAMAVLAKACAADRTE